LPTALCKTHFGCATERLAAWFITSMHQRSYAYSTLSADRDGSEFTVRSWTVFGCKQAIHTNAAWPSFRA